MRNKINIIIFASLWLLPQLLTMLFYPVVGEALAGVSSLRDCYFMDYQEFWVAIDEWPSYQINNYGEVRRLSVKNPPTLRKTQVAPNGYRHILLRDGIKEKQFAVHRLTMLNFSNIKKSAAKKLTVGHLDNWKVNNTAANLVWLTVKENARAAWRDGLCEKIGFKTGCKAHEMNCKSVIKMTVDGLFLQEYKSSSHAFRDTLIDGSSIIKCCRGRRKMAGGFKWSYKVTT